MPLLSSYHDKNIALDATHQDLLSHTWKPLRLLNQYRLILSGLFVVLIVFRNEPLYFGSINPQLATYTSLAYLIFSAISSFTIRWQRPGFTVQLYSQTLADIVAISVLMFASGGVGSGLGVLLVVAIAGGSVIMASRMANLFAAVATLAILLEETYASATFAFPVSYSHAGILGATFFATAILAYVLARKLRETEQLAAQRGVDLANLSELNDYVIQRMQSGILVIDAKGHIRLSNNSAWIMLDISSLKENQSIESVSPQLSEQLKAWQINRATGEPRVFKPSGTSTDILPRFMPLGADEAAGTLIFLEDTSVMAQQAQQIKMASLGRLTASIAHEVRNPLGAISHAGQLLAESPSLEKSDIRLTEIICHHSDRVNKIVENVLQLSRSDKSKPQKLVLSDWLNDFANEFRRDQHIDANEISVDVTPPELEILMDPSQLHQVLWNLCQNGLRHSADWPNMPKVELIGGIIENAQTPYIDIIDHGPGIDTETALKIFEPFFTTQSSGTGLGLYIARELCEANNARLIYIPMPKSGSCFRISFSHMNLYH